MLGYAIIIIAITLCYVYVRWSKKLAYVKSERIIHAIPDMVFILDSSLRILKLYNLNPAVLLVVPEKLTGTNLCDFFPEQEVTKFKAGVRTALDSNEIVEAEYALEVNAGTQYFEVRFLKIDDNVVTCIIRDITKRKIADLAVKQNQELLNSVLDNMPFPVMLKDVNDHFRYVYWNNECNNQSGFLREEILGKTDIDLYGPERGGNYQRIDRQVVGSGKFYSAREEFITPDGVRHDTIVTKNIITNDMYTWMLVIRRDITDFIQIQNALKEINQLNRLILDNSHAGYIFVGADHTVKWENVNRILSDRVKLAYQKGKKCYETVRGLDHVCPDCILESVINSGKTERKELFLEEDIIAEMVATPVWDTNKQLNGCVLKIEDVTQKKKAEEELRQAKEDAEKSDRLKSAFLANISHEIRTPLNAIVGFSELLCNTSNSGEQDKYREIIRGNNELLLQLISDILDISKIESDTFDFIYSGVRINDLFAELKETFVFKTGTLAGVKVVIHSLPEDLTIYTEKTRLLQVLIHLLGNAIKFTEKGKIEIGCENRQKELYFYVSDTGIGIPENKQKVIFQRFIKLDNFKNGTGLGLPICQTIIHKLDGEIGVISKPDEGSTFWFTLPYRPLETKEK